MTAELWELLLRDRLALRWLLVLPLVALCSTVARGTLGRVVLVVHGAAAALVVVAAVALARASAVRGEWLGFAPDGVGALHESGAARQAVARIAAGGAVVAMTAACAWRDRRSVAAGLALGGALRWPLTGRNPLWSLPHGRDVLVRVVLALLTSVAVWAAARRPRALTLLAPVAGVAALMV